MGFEFITSTRLNTNASSQRQVLAWAEDGLTLAVGKDLMTQITQRADKSYSTQVYVLPSLVPLAWKRKKSFKSFVRNRRA